MCLIMTQVPVDLTAKYAAFQTIWDSINPARQTIENLQEKLLIVREENRLSVDTDGATALAAIKISKTSDKTSRSEDSKKKSKKKLHQVKFATLSVIFVRQRGITHANAPNKRNKTKTKSTAVKTVQKIVRLLRRIRVASETITNTCGDCVTRIALPQRKSFHTLVALMYIT